MKPYLTVPYILLQPHPSLVTLSIAAVQDYIHDYECSALQTSQAAVHPSAGSLTMPPSSALLSPS